MTGHFSDVTVSRLALEAVSQNGWQTLFSKRLIQVACFNQRMILGE